MKAGIEAADWPAVNALLDEALSLPPPERAAWLEALPEERRRYRDTIAGLLAASTGIETDQLLRWPRFTMGAPGRTAGDEQGDADGAAEGDVVGPYILFRVLGRGGMGAVWLAERADQQPRRKVALKLPHVGWQAGLATRLARERDILASLEHPHIARLYDAGVDAAGRPWLALEYVDGTPIDRYCERHALGVRARLGLVLQVASAVAHAHTRLVIHRDLKPSNILVTDAGEVRLLDFGIAKLLHDGDVAADATELTRVSGRALTPDYASPEQLRGEPVGTASDVYSLGVVAYELLVGQRPQRFEPGKAVRWADDSDSVDAPLASRAAADATTRRELTGDLDAILAKALKKAGGERYSTVAEFSTDIRRHLDDLPVEARPDRLGYRTRKFVRRHLWQLAMAALMFATVLTGAGIALWQASSARAEAARAEQVKRFALSIFQEADTNAGAGVATTAVELLQKAQRRIESEVGSNPRTAVELMTSIASSLAAQGRIEEGGELARRAMVLGRLRLGADDMLTIAAALAHARALVAAGRYKEGEKLLAETAAQAERAHAPVEQVAALSALADARSVQGELPTAREASQASVDVAVASATKIGNVEVAAAWLNHAMLLQRIADKDFADAAQRGLAAARDAYGDRPVFYVLIARSLVADAEGHRGHGAEGVVELQRLVGAFAELLGPEHPRAIQAVEDLAFLERDVGHYGAAIEHFRRAMQLKQEAGRLEADSIVTAHREVGDSLVAIDKPAESLDEFLQAESAWTTGKDVDPRDRYRIVASRGGALTQLGRLEEADQAFAALATLETSNSDRAFAASSLGRLRSLQGRHAEALALTSGAVTSLAHVESRIIRADTERRLGTALLAAGRASDAVGPLRQAVQHYRGQQIVDTPAAAEAAMALAVAQR